MSAGDNVPPPGSGGSDNFLIGSAQKGRLTSNGPLSSKVGVPFPGNSFPIWQDQIPLSLNNRAPDRFQNAFPSSYKQAQGVSVNQFAGVSGFQAQVTTNGFPIKQWGNLRWQDQMFEGELAYIFRSEAQEPAVSCLTIRWVNHILRTRYNMIDAAVKEARASSKRIGLFDKTELDNLMSLPTSCWVNNAKYMNSINSTSDATGRMLSYLNLNSVTKDWNFFGTLIGQMQPHQTGIYNVSAMVRRGLAREVVNIWGPSVKGNQDLYIIRTRIQTKSGEWGPMAFIPWNGFGRPTQNELSYIDYTGHIAVGEAEYIGTILLLNDKCPVHLPYDEHAGIVPRQNTNLMVTSPLNCTMRVILKSRNCYKLNLVL